jgi:uncharacterized RDD family membrane protein YckC
MVLAAQIGDALAVSFPAGWYDDPRDQSQQRFWDGAAWTEHRRPRPGPPPYQAQPPHQTAQYQGAPQNTGAPQYQDVQRPGAAQYHGAPQPQYQGAPAYQGPGFGYGSMVPSTPDGVPLSGWWKRVWARLLDGLIVLIVSLPLTGYFWYHYIGALVDYQNEVFDRAVAGETTSFNATPPWDVYQWAIPAALIALAVNFVYEYFFLVRSGATPGKKALGISVRLREVPGPPPPLAVAKRFGLYSALSLLSSVPVVGSLFSLLSLLNYLWPLWDDKKQALHDKVAATNVVRT